MSHDLFTIGVNGKMQGGLNNFERNCRLHFIEITWMIWNYLFMWIKQSTDIDHSSCWLGLSQIWEFFDLPNPMTVVFEPRLKTRFMKFTIESKTQEGAAGFNLEIYGCSELSKFSVVFLHQCACHEFHETCHFVTVYFMKKDSKNDAVTPQRQSQFTPKM